MQNDKVNDISQMTKLIQMNVTEPLSITDR